MVPVSPQSPSTPNTELTQASESTLVLHHLQPEENEFRGKLLTQRWTQEDKTSSCRTEKHFLCRYNK
ncbi:hypothetical protein A6R68_18742, partial [Neotoma lepida]